MAKRGADGGFSVDVEVVQKGNGQVIYLECGPEVGLVAQNSPLTSIVVEFSHERVPGQ